MRIKFEELRGGDATAANIYADAFNEDPEFYEFTRSLKAYQMSLKTNQMFF